MYQVTCAGCGVKFKAKSPRAKWHNAACRKRAQRAATKATKSAPAKKAVAKRPARRDSGSTSASVLDRHDLVVSVRRDLETAGKLETFQGQLAVQLARRIADPNETGASPLSKELRAVMAVALTVVAPAADESAEAAEHEDEVTRARKAREEARQAAGRT